MLLELKLFCLFVGLVSTAQLPSSIQKCSKSDPKSNECFTSQARQFMPTMIKGLPEFGIESMDPLALSNLESKSGTFTLKCTNVIVKGMKNIEVKELAFDWDKNSGHMRIFGNVTFLSNYETVGRLLLLPLSGKGNLTVKIWDLDVRTTYKIKVYKDENGVEHLKSYNQKPSSSFGFVKMRLTNILGESGALDGPINQVINDNWKDLMVDLGPPFVQAIFNKVESLVNKFYAGLDFNDMILP